MKIRLYAVQSVTMATLCVGNDVLRGSTMIVELTLLAMIGRFLRRVGFQLQSAFIARGDSGARNVVVLLLFAMADGGIRIRTECFVGEWSC